MPSKSPETQRMEAANAARKATSSESPVLSEQVPTGTLRNEPLEPSTSPASTSAATDNEPAKAKSRAAL